VTKNKDPPFLSQSSEKRRSHFKQQRHKHLINLGDISKKAMGLSRRPVYALNSFVDVLLWHLFQMLTSLPESTHNRDTFTERRTRR